jgi:protein-disulfide isomerase
MKNSRVLLVSFLLLLSGAVVPGQTAKRRVGARPPAPKTTAPQPTPEPVVAAAASSETKPPIPLASINGQTITTADIDPRAAEEMQTLDERIRQARRDVLELQINTVLLEMEAKKRKLPTHQVYELEVVKHITDPSEADIQKFIEANRDQLTDSDPAGIRAQVVAFLRNDQEGKISDDFVKRLRASYGVVMGADINTPNLGDSVVVAKVAGEPILSGAIFERLKPVIYKLRLNTYQVAKEALERTVKDILLLAEARRRGIQPEEIVRAEVSEKVHVPTEAEVAKFYSENKAQIPGELDTARNQIVSYLQDQEQLRLERAMADRLQKGAEIHLLISEPDAPIQSISTDDDPSRGNPDAPVTLVEFTDFQCPACAAMHPVLEQVLSSYGNKVRLVVRDFPLSMHANARKAAEAADAANAQGKFFEYIALLFKRQKSLDVPSLKKYASELGLSRPRFDAALDNGTYADEVKHDIDDGEKYGVGSTPTIFVNGVMLTTLNAEGLRAAIDRALASPHSPPKAATK